MTKEELKQTGLALVALSEGKDVQIKSRYGRDETLERWRDYNPGQGESCPDYSSWLWRIKPTPAKRLKRPDELPDFFWVRKNGTDIWKFPYDFWLEESTNVLRIYVVGSVSPIKLCEHEYSTDRKTAQSFFTTEEA